MDLRPARLGYDSQAAEDDTVLILFSVPGTFGQARFF
jgi:hypothetical protein